jgi:hypothetical protein
LHLQTWQTRRRFVQTRRRVFTGSRRNEHISPESARTGLYRSSARWLEPYLHLRGIRRFITDAEAGEAVLDDPSSLSPDEAASVPTRRAMIERAATGSVCRPAGSRLPEATSY